MNCSVQISILSSEEPSTWERADTFGSAPWLGRVVGGEARGIEKADSFCADHQSIGSYPRLPTSPWNPLIRITRSHPGILPASPFGFHVIWVSGMTVVVDACAHVANPTWIPLATNTLTGGSSYSTDPQWTNYPARFYRAHWP
jgi:hypothetical protein